MCTFWDLGAEGSGYQASPHFSLDTDCVILQEFKSEANGLPFKESSSRGGTLQAGPGLSQHQAAQAGAGLGLWLGGGVGGLGDPAQVPHALPTASAKWGRGERQNGGQKGRWDGSQRKQEPTFSPPCPPPQKLLFWLVEEGGWKQTPTDPSRGEAPGLKAAGLPS